MFHPSYCFCGLPVDLLQQAHALYFRAACSSPGGVSLEQGRGAELPPSICWPHCFSCGPGDGCLFGLSAHCTIFCLIRLNELEIAPFRLVFSKLFVRLTLLTKPDLNGNWASPSRVCLLPHLFFPCSDFCCFPCLSKERISLLCLVLQPYLSMTPLRWRLVHN